jgi:hypothetical protein
MTAWTPEWALEVNGAGDITDLVIADLTITSGRSDIYSQPVAGYCRFTIKNVNQAAITYDVNDSVVIKVKNSIVIGITHQMANQGNGPSKWAEASGTKIQYLADMKLRATHMETWEDSSKERIGTTVMN